MRNPKWHRDEIILALNLYFQIEPGQVHARNPKIIELSNTLNKLHIHEVRRHKETFRNPNGVSLKLSNFLAIDPSYSGKGMQSYSQQDKDIFFEFYQDKDTLRRIATSIFNVLSNNSAAEKLYKILDEDDEAIGAKEGKVLYVLHKVRERDRRIVSRKKKEATRKFNKLACEVCGFDFYALYGELGEGFIECHHVSPLAEYRADQETRLEDLALVCSNCHRMLHKKINYLTPERLKSLIKHSNEERNWT